MSGIICDGCNLPIDGGALPYEGKRYCLDCFPEAFSLYGPYLWNCKERHCRRDTAQNCGYMRDEYGWQDIAKNPEIKCDCLCHGTT